MILGRTVTVLASLLVLFALLVPDQLTRVGPGAFVRIPLEVLIGVALVLVLPARARTAVVLVGGVLLGLLTIVKVVNMGFFAAFDRPFSPVLDWSFFPPAVDFLGRSLGRGLAVLAVIVAILLIAAIPTLMVLSVFRLAKIVRRHRTAATRSVAGLTVVWIACAAFGLHIAGMPVADRDTSTLAVGQVRQAHSDIQNLEAFAGESATDAYRDTLGADLLTGLRGKNVLLTFVESYGRVAIEDPQLAPAMDALLDAGTSRLKAAGFDSRSAFLTSSTAGGGSWLAHSTLQSGLWIDNQGRYADLVSGDRLTLSAAFRRAGWRTVGMVPANNEDWPEGRFYNYSNIYDARNIGYHGPAFSFQSIPDQYTMSFLQRSVLSTADHPPTFAEIDLLSSHAPWEPVPDVIGWNQIGDGSVYGTTSGAGDPADSVLSRDVTRVKADYGKSIAYSLDTLISYVQTYGDDNLVLVYLGDHQPAPIVAGEGATRDVPITIVAKDPAVLDRISSWGWQPGLRPDPRAPVWRMDTFRNQFLGAFGSKASPTS